MNTILIIFYLAISFVMLLLGTYNWVYKKHALKAGAALGLQMPIGMSALLHFNIAFPLLIGLCSLFFLILTLMNTLPRP